MMRISITGPESTGKSWLAENLAIYYNSRWVPEYAREYLQEINRPYHYEDILTIAKGQLKAEDLAAKTGKLLFCDTDLLVTSIWCQVKYGKCHEWIDTKLKEHKYQLYLLCDIDLPWEYDPLREHPEMRQELFDTYFKVLKENGFKYEIVKGAGKARLENAIGFVNKLL